MKTYKTKRVDVQFRVSEFVEQEQVCTQLLN